MRIRALKSELAFACFLLFILSLTAATYWPGIAGPFIFDDRSNLIAMSFNGGVYDLDRLREFVFSNFSGPTGRPISMLSFLLNAQDWPADAASFKYTNILIHLLCGLALCWLAYLITQLRGLSRESGIFIASIATAFWLLHPLNVSTTLYVIQRMAQLMTLFAALALVFYLLGRRIQETNPVRSGVYLVLSLFPFGLLSALSKENGALLLLLIVLMEWLLFFSAPRTRLVNIWYRAGVVLPLILLGLYLTVTAPGNLELYASREFTLVERLLSETRILSLYLGKILFPDPFIGGVFHESFEISRSLFNPFTTLLSALFLFCLISSAVCLRKRHPVYSFGVLWFFSMHLLESTYLPLELYFEHRNYLAMFGPLFTLAWYFRLLLVSTAASSLRKISIIFLAALFLFSTLQTSEIVSRWKSFDSLITYMAERWPTSRRSLTEYARYLSASGQVQDSIVRWHVAREYYPNEVTILLDLWNYHCLYGLEEPLSLDEITTNPDLEYFGDSIHFHIDRLLSNLVNQRCTGPEKESVINLLERIGLFPMAQGRRILFLYSYAKINVYFGDTAGALANIQSIHAASPSENSAINLAVFSISLGQEEEALQFLEEARRMETNRSWLLPSRESEMSRIQTLIRDLINRNRQID